MLWYLHRPGSGIGPNAHSALVSASTGFQHFRIISTPLGRTPKVVLGCSQAQKNMRGAIIYVDKAKLMKALLSSKNKTGSSLDPSRLLFVCSRLSFDDMNVKDDLSKGYTVL